MIFGNMFPALGGRHNFEKQHKKSNSPGQSKMHELRKCDPHARWERRFPKQQATRTLARAVPLAKMKESCGDFQETCFYDILAAEGSQRQCFALPPSTGINTKYDPHLARGSHFWYLQPL